MRFKNCVISVSIAVILLCSASERSFASSAKIRNAVKTQRMGYYIIAINYETYDTWTDSLVFKVHCKFKKGEFTFTSATLNNISQGWHKTQIGISEVMKQRYGPLKEYKIELYCKGMLIDEKNVR